MKAWKQMAVTAAMLAAASFEAQAGATIPIGENKSLSVGFGMRYSYSRVEDGASDGSHSSDFNLDSARLFLNGTLNKNIGGMLTTEWDGDHVRILDAVGQFSLAPEFNIWAGRMVSPSDRANMAGPYYSLGGDYWAGVASRYGYNGGIFRGRDDGVTAWGNFADGKLSYSFGVFEGHTFGVGSLTESEAKTAGVRASDKPMVAGRVQYAFWDAEPGYYGTGTYLGTKNILSVGIAARQQKDGVLTVGGVGDYSSWSADFLLEKRLGTVGAITLEAAYYNYDTDNVVLSEQGKAWLAGAGYIVPISKGSLQPYVRFQKFSADTGIDTRRDEVGVNWIIEGYNAQLGALYSRTRITRADPPSRFAITLQLQY